MTSTASFIAVSEPSSQRQSKAGSLLAQTKKAGNGKRPTKKGRKMNQLGLISLIFVLGTCVKAIDLTRLYDLHNKREAIAGMK